MAGDDLILKAIIESALDAKGFEEFKNRLGEATAAANKAGPGLGNVAEGVDRVSKRLGSVGLNILTSQLLQSTGASTGFTRVLATGAATVGAYAASLGPWGLAMAAAAAAGAALSSRVQQKREAMEKAKEAADKLAETDSKLVDQLNNLKIKLGELTPALEEYRRQLDETRKVRQLETIIGLQAEQFALRQNQQAILDQIRVKERLLNSDKRVAETTPLLRDQLKELNVEYAKNDKLLLDVGQKLDREVDARRAGAIDIAHQVTALEAEAAARERGFKSVEAERRAKEALRRVDKQAELDSAVNFRRERQQADSMEKLLADEARQREKNARDAKADEADLLLLQMESAQAKQQLDRETFANAASLLSAAFPKDKGLAIAAALINTYQGATKAIAQGGFAGFAMAAAVIAFGLAQVAKIRETEAGFDLPENDAMARHFGMKWAGDLLQNINAGFMAAVAARPGPGGGTTNITRNTTINRGPIVNGGLSVGGFFGRNETDMVKRLSRALAQVERRIERRTALR